ncbi:phosphate ABC transporter permease subunit PstC [Candidatus Desulforudis audaxviator]|uniref:Phosphate ABC transporter, inner membrane subunit PstC n=1 Tax=Desulforudis audaxviator (strain MP104C) TaxID=477974 RepID=B1I5X0_DESAP|nr:phosphate ABC transporter permease subunit PstC [Candidatus Desulforudis audaxviator]ACA60450.1 phosphate ABC transporter, inner membrane subunit PstC [Candidatus Desulforudis audaxviator MP104C]
MPGRGSAISRRWYERIVEKCLLGSAAAAVLIVFLIGAFVLLEGLPILSGHGLDFMFGRDWSPLQGVFGVFPMIVGTFYVTIGALILGVPVGLACAVYLAEYAPRWFARLIRPAVQLLAGIPSVVYGFFGVVVLVPFIMDNLGGWGFSVLAGALVLALMILPTIIGISEDAIRAVPVSYKEGSLSLGATHWQTIKKVLLPTARPGIVASVVLGMGRAIGETMAVIMVVGNVVALPHSILDPVRTLTANIALEMGYAFGDHTRALFATGVVLFMVIILLNMFLLLLPKRMGT